MSGTDYTVAMKKLVEGSNSELRSFYCREDLDFALRRLRTAEEDSRIFLKADLERLCRPWDLDADALLANPALRNAVPTRADLQDRLLEILHDNYQRFYSSADYMERMVRRLAPEYRGDTVRTAILKKFILGAGFVWRNGKRVGRQYRTEAILSWARERFSAEESREYPTLSEPEKLRLLAKKLDDTIFSAEHMNTGLNEGEWFFLIVRRVTDWVGTLKITEDGNSDTEASGGAGLFADLPLREETKEKIRTFCEEHCICVKSDETGIGCLKQIAKMLKNESLSSEQAGDCIQPFFELLKEDFDRFLKNTRYINQKGTSAKMSALFKTNLRDESRKKAADWELLRLCDDYASGKFRTNGGKTRVYLYYFAIMFDMTFRLKESDLVCEDTDLEKNLFEDYYSDNVIRFLREEYADGRTAAQFESEPAGDGINYKNYAEVIYLYYLGRRELPLVPGARIDRAEKTIFDCRTAAQAKGVRAQNRKVPESFTDYFREEHFRTLMGLDEADLPDFITENYQILSENSEGRAATMIASEENAAYDNVELIMENLDAAYRVSIEANRMFALERFAHAGERREARRDARDSENKFFCWELPALLREKYPEDTDFLRVIDSLDRRLSHPERNISPEDRRVTRSTFLSLCLSDYIPVLEDVENIDSFPELYRDFLDRISPQLEDARFQTFQEKNLMDLYVLLSLYFYVIKNGK